MDFPGGSVVGSLPANAGNAGSFPVREDPTCLGAVKTTTEACALQQEKSPPGEDCAPQPEGSHRLQQRRPILKSLLIKVNEDSEKVSLKLNVQKTKTMASGPITSWQIDGATLETVVDSILWAPKSL